MATKSYDTGSDEVITTKCCTCEKKKILKEAKKYCIECQDYYCIPCTDLHTMFPMMKGHKLLDITDFSTTRLRPSLPCVPTERCHEHEAKVLEMYCRNHDEVICGTCVKLNHRMCQDIHPIPYEIDSLYQQIDSNGTMKQLTSEKENAEGIRIDKEHLLRKLKEHRKKATDSIQDYRKEMEVELKRLETEAINEVDVEYGKIESVLLSEIKELDENTNNLQRSADKLEKSSRNKAQTFVCVKTAENYLTTSIKSRNHLERPIDVEIGFLAEPKIRNFLKEFKTLGQMSVEKTTYTPMSNAYTVSQEKDINIRLKEDGQTCMVFGSCFTADGMLLITDYSNSKLKRLDVSTKSIKDHLDLAAGPFAVCQTSKQEAAVSLTNNSVQFVSLGDKMTTIRLLKMNNFCSGLAFNEGQLFISDEHSTVYIHDITGTLLHKVTTDKSGKQRICDSKHISVNSDNVYVADYKKGLITLDTQGNHLSTFTDPDLKSPFGVCTDGRGNIFVCGFESSNIVQISESSRKKLGTISTEGNPVSVCFNTNHNTLVVTLNRSDNLKVFELQ